MKYDIVIVGAGIIGMTSAFYLKKNNPKKKILVIERNLGAGQGNTAQAAGMFRHIFASVHNTKLAYSSIQFYKRIQKEYDICLKETGYLWLLSKKQYADNYANIQLMKRRGIKVLACNELLKYKGIRIDLNLEDPEIQMMGLEDIHMGIYCTECGELDQTQLVNYYRDNFLARKGEILYQTNVESLKISPPLDFGVPLLWQDYKITGVKTDREDIEASKVILACGAYNSCLLDSLGTPSFSRPKKRQLFQVRAPALERLLDLPFVVLPKAGVFLKPDKSAKAFLVGGADHFGRHFDLDTHPEKRFYEYSLHPILTKYIPAFERAQVVNSQAGLYDINYIDGVPYVYDTHNLIVAGGCSGSGIMKADAIGRIVDALYREESNVKLFGDVDFAVSDIGITCRNVEKESFIL